jgi:hypothetical protein
MSCGIGLSAGVGCIETSCHAFSLARHIESFLRVNEECGVNRGLIRKVGRARITLLYGLDPVW